MEKRGVSPSKKIAFAAVMCALLIGGQYVFSFVSGVEIVTVLLVSFSFVAGVKLGMLCALAFSLLRCVLFGFYPNVVVLYLIYYPALALAFGGLGKIKEQTYQAFPWWFALLINALLALLAGGCLSIILTDAIKVSRIYKVTFVTLLWVIFALAAALLFAFNGLLIAKKKFQKDTSAVLKLITVTSVSAIFTVLFTLLDDVISPAVLGYSRAAWLTYFYASFTAMLPQTVCAVATVSALFLPVTKVLQRCLYAKN